MSRLALVVRQLGGKPVGNVAAAVETTALSTGITTDTGAAVEAWGQPADNRNGPEQEEPAVVPSPQDLLLPLSVNQSDEGKQS